MLEQEIKADGPLKTTRFATIDEHAELCGPPIIVLPSLRYFVFTLKIRDDDHGDRPLFLVRHRYSDFLFFREFLKNRFTGLAIPLLPRKSLWAVQDKSFLTARARRLEKFMNSILSHEVLGRSEAVLKFLTNNEGPAFESVKLEMCMNEKTRSKFEICRVYQHLYPNLMQGHVLSNFDVDKKNIQIERIYNFLVESKRKLLLMAQEVYKVREKGQAFVKAYFKMLRDMNTLESFEHHNHLDSIESLYSSISKISWVLEFAQKEEDQSNQIMVEVLTNSIDGQVQEIDAFLQVFQRYRQVFSEYKSARAILLKAQSLSLKENHEYANHEKAVQTERQMRRLFAYVSIVIEKVQFARTFVSNIDSMIKAVQNFCLSASNKVASSRKNWMFAQSILQCPYDEILLESSLQTNEGAAVLLLSAYFRGNIAASVKSVPGGVYPSTLFDLFIHPVYRNTPLTSWFIRCVLNHPLLRNSSLISLDAQEDLRKVFHTEHFTMTPGVHCVVSHNS